VCGPYSVHDVMPMVVEQLSLLWSLRLIKMLFDPLFTYMSALGSPHQSNTSVSSVAAVSPSPSKSMSSPLVFCCLHEHLPVQAPGLTRSVSLPDVVQGD